MQSSFAQDIERAIDGTAPTIRELLHAYELEQLEVWMMAQIENLNNFAGVKQKMRINQMQELAGILLQKCQHLKATEILLFFFKLKGGDFGGFYGVVDPQKVAEYFNVFMQWRREKFAIIQIKNEEIRRNHERKEWKQKCITRAQYEASKRLKNANKDP